MKILITDFFGIMAGSSFSALYLGEGLASRGHEVCFASKRGSFLERQLRGLGFKNLIVTNPFKYNIVAANKLALYARQNKIEVVLAQASPDRYLTAMARGLFFMPGKVIHTRRQRPVAAGRGLKAKLFTKATDQVVAVSEAVKGFLVTSGMDPDHITVIHNAIPAVKGLTPQPAAVEKLRIKYGIVDGDLVIGCVARSKKQDQLLKALKQLEIPVKLILIGITDYDKAIAQELPHLPDRHRVFCTGEIPNEEVMVHYAIFTMFILPSDMEGLSQSLMEAMINGVPVIATRASGNPELIDHGQTGLLFEDNDIDQLQKMILNVWENKSSSQSMATAAKEKVEHQFGMETMIDRYERLFQQLSEA